METINSSSTPADDYKNTGWDGFVYLDISKDATAAMMIDDLFDCWAALKDKISEQSRNEWETVIIIVICFWNYQWVDIRRVSVPFLQKLYY